MKGADKSSVVVVWDREHYIQEAENQLGGTNLYKEIPNDTKPVINNILHTYL